MEALRKACDKIRYVHMRHEEAAAMAAVGYAKFSGKLGVCFSTAAPDAVHMLNGLYDAKIDRAPVLAITGMTYHDLIGTHYLQDINQDYLFQDVALFNQRIMGPAHAENMIELACRAALGNRGVAHLAIPIDYQIAEMSSALKIDPERRTALVEPGAINDTVRQAAERYHLTFGPDPATHSYCTIGGMIGNNSCGIHSVRWGKTVDNIKELDILTYDGLRMRAAAASDAALTQIANERGRRGAIYRNLRALRDRTADLVRSHFPKIPRRVSGYNLDQLLPENGFNVARALVGTESTCVIVLRATLDLVESPPFRTLIVIGYLDVFRLADAVPAVRELKPLALEGFETHVVENLERKGIEVPAAKLLPHGQSWMLVEFGSDSQAQATSMARAAAEKIRKADHTLLGIEIFDTAAEQGKIWHLQESGVAASRGARRRGVLAFVGRCCRRAGQTRWIPARFCQAGRGLPLQVDPVRPFRRRLRPHADQLRSEVSGGGTAIPFIHDQCRRSRRVLRRLPFRRTRRWRSQRRSAAQDVRTGIDARVP